MWYDDIWYKLAWVKVFRIIPEFRVLRLTFHRKSASKSWIREFTIASDVFSVCLKTFILLNLKLWIFGEHTACFKIGVLKVQDFGNFELSPMNWWFPVNPAVLFVHYWCSHWRGLGLPSFLSVHPSFCWNLELFKLAWWSLVFEQVAMCWLCISFNSSSHENCGCYSNGYSQNVAKTYGSRDDSKAIQASLMKPGPEARKFFSCSAQLSMELKLLTKTKMLKYKDFSCFQTLRCCIYHANKC